MVSKGAAPAFDDGDPGRNATLRQPVSVYRDWTYKLELRVRFEGYRADADDPADNPFFSAELVRLQEAEEDTDGEWDRVVLFDVRNYGGVFERLDDWATLQ